MGKTAAEERLAQLTGKKSADGLGREELMREGFEGIAGAFGGLAAEVRRPRTFS